MSLYIQPQTVSLTPNLNALTFDTPRITIIETGGTLLTHPLQFSYTVPTTGAVVNQAAPTSGAVSISLFAADAYRSIVTFSTTIDAFGTFPVTVLDPVSGDTGEFTVSIAPAGSDVPTGYSSTSLCYAVRLLANEPTLPVNSDIIILANMCVEQVVREIGGIRVLGTFPTVPNQNIQALTNDIQDILSCSWSTGPISAPGALVYPMVQFDPGTFMDFAAGFPTVGFGPPTAYYIFNDESGTLTMQLYPAAMLGQLNVYYRARPQLWNLQFGGINVTNLDSSMQDAVLLWTVERVLCARGRAGEAKEIWQPQREAAIESIKASAKRRVNPRQGQVRDVLNGFNWTGTTMGVS